MKKPKIGHVVTIVLNAYLGPTTNNLVHGSHDAKGRPRPQYVEKRWGVFERYTLRSLVAQTTQDFGVVLLYDQRLSLADQLTSSAGVRKLGSRFRAVGISPIDFRGSGVSRAFWAARKAEDRAILELCPADASRILVSHIDSDDAYAVDYLDRTREVEISPGLQSISAGLGYIYDEKHHRLRRYRDPHGSPPFYTLIFSRSQVEQGYRPLGGPGHHSEVNARTQSKTLTGDDNYLVVVHEFNDSTRFRGYGGVLEKTACTCKLKHFGL